MQKKLSELVKSKKFLNFAIVIVALLPAVLLTLQVILQSRNTPYMDQWELVTDFKAIDEGSFDLGDIWKQHNEHRLVFPRAIMISAAYVTHWNVRVEMLISILLALGMLAVLVRIFMSINPITKNKWIYTLTILITSVFLFSFSQAENWLWGWQIQWYLSCLGFIVMIWALDRKNISTNYQSLAILSAFISTYSLGNGQFSWLIGGFILFVRNKKLKYWITAALISLFAYHLNLQRTGLETPITDLIIHPIKPILYFFVYLGRPISENIYFACIAGFTGLLVFIGCIVFAYLVQKGTFRKRSEILIVPISLASFAIISAAITTISRSSLGIGQALASRYTTVSNLFWIGVLTSFLIAISYMRFKRQYYKELITSNTLCFFLTLAIIASNSATIFFTQHVHLMKTIQYCTNGPNPSDSCLKTTYPHPNVVRDRVEYLKQRGWAGYSEARSTD